MMFNESPSRLFLIRRRASRLSWLAGASLLLAPAQAAPVIRAGGVVNAASFRPSVVPGSGLAQGSLASIFGTGLGPAQGVSASAFPLSTGLAGVSVRITLGPATVEGYPVFVNSQQINFLVPSTTPVGLAEVRVVYNSETSAPVAAQIVRTAFGLFTFVQGSQRAVVQNFVSASELPVNLPDVSAKPGQTLIAYGTGFGAIAAADNLAPPAGEISAAAVEILVGGVAAKRVYAGRSPCCAGLDQIVFELPAGVPTGCTVPLVIRAGDTYSNIGDISVSAAGGRCSDVSAAIGSLVCRDGSAGSILLYESLTEYALIEQILGFTSGYFLRSSGCAVIPALNLGSCTVETRLTNAPSTAPAPPQPTPVQPPVTFTFLDGGPTLTIRSPASEKQLLRAGPSYVGPTWFGAPPFLTAGRYTLSGPGGRDVGAFSASLDFAPIRITRPAKGSAVNLNTPLTVTWSGGGGASDYFAVGATFGDNAGTFTTSIRCSIPGGRTGSFTFPQWVWSQIPPISSGYGFVSGSGGSFYDPVTINAPGLDYGIALNFLTSHLVQFTVGQ